MGELHHKIISLVNSYVNILIYPLSKLLALPFISKKKADMTQKLIQLNY